MPKQKKVKPTKVIIKPQNENEFSGKSGPIPGKKKIIEKFASGSANQQFFRWWAIEDKSKLYDTVNATVNKIEASQTPLRMSYLKHQRMYGNYQSLGFSNASNDFNSIGNYQGSKRVIFNVVQSCVDGITAKIAKDQPKVTIVSNGAKNFMNKMKATKLTKLVNAIMKASGAYDNCEEVFRSAGIIGNGYIKFFREDGQIKSEFISGHEIVVDYADGMKSSPRSMHQIKFVSRDMLMIAYRDEPEKVSRIESAKSCLNGQMLVSSAVDMVEVIESWHLPSNPAANDGLHCITVDNCTLFHEEYTKDYFPILAWRWMPNSLSFFGRSITEEIGDKQIEIANIMNQIKQSIDLVAVPTIFVPNAAEIPMDKMASNYIARIIKYHYSNGSKSGGL